MVCKKICDCGPVLFSFSPTDQKMVSCSDDGTLRVWDFARCHEERVLRGKYKKKLMKSKGRIITKMVAKALKN